MKANGRDPVFACRGVRVHLGEREIVKGVDLEVRAGETHALMGPNGSGKSTLVAALAGHPSYRLAGEVWIDGERVDGLAPEERARRGLFLGFQHPVPIPGVSVASFLRAAVSARRGESVGVRELRAELYDAFEAFGIPREFAGRYVNDGFSGGEKKRLEVLQMALLAPRIALLDEIDSGLDIDALKVVARGIARAVEGGAGVVLVTHYQRILDHVRPDRVHVFVDGRIARTGGAEQALELERTGYEAHAAVVAP
jgi:Fe-S cluster assembly ATP-binding protein